MTTVRSQATPHDRVGVSEVSPAEARRWLDAGEAVLIDVREPDENARERIEGSALMPLAAFDPARAASLAGPGKRIVLHCRGGVRSADAFRVMNAAVPGIDARSMAGGIEAWKKAGLPLRVDARVSRVSIMRQVQMVAGGCVLAGSTLAWFVDPRFIGISAFFGAGLLFAGASGFCGMATLLALMPWNRPRAGGGEGVGGGGSGGGTQCSASSSA